MYDLKPQIGPYVFEGTMLFTTRRLVKPDEKKITFNVLFEVNFYFRHYQILFNKSYFSRTNQ